MKNLFNPILLILFLSTTSFAQFESIDLNKYKLTDFRYGSLSTNLSMNGYYNKNNHIIDAFNYNSTTKNKQLNSLLNLNYSLYINNRSYIGYHSISGSYSHNFMNSTERYNSSTDYEYENTHNAHQMFISTLNSFYLNEKIFLGANIKSSSNQDNTMRKIMNIAEPQFTEKNIIFNSNNELSLQIGYGRVENVTDARQAIYILDELNKKSRLTHQLTQEETFEFADFINKVLNKRIIDSREKRIESYTLVDSFLVSKGLISKQDGKYFGILSDNWNYARTQSWMTGSKIYFGIVSHLNNSNLFHKKIVIDDPDSGEKYTQEVMNKSIGAEVGYETNWIKGLKWINSFGCNLSVFIDHYDPYNSNETYSERNQKYNVLESNVAYSLSFVPNTRTTITGRAGILYRFDKDSNNNKQTHVSPSASILCNYYFNEKLQLNIYNQVDYYRTEGKSTNRNFTQKDLRFDFRVTLNYFFF